MSEIKIEVGTFPSRDEGLPTMGLMIQTPNPVDIKNEIQTALKLQELVKKYDYEIKNFTDSNGRMITNELKEFMDKLHVKHSMEKVKN